MPALFRVALSLVLAAASAAAADESSLPAYIIELPETVADVFIADAGESRIYRFARTGGGVTLAHEGYMSIGERGTGKEKAWDRRTPLGIYFVVDQLDTDNLHEQYGVTAFPLDYPNTWDRLQRRSGDGIWVHGALPGGGRRPPYDTDGCISLSNGDLRALEDRFVPRVTPVIVTREMRWQDENTRAELRAGLRRAVDDWVRHYAAAELHAYLSMYAPEFRYRGMSLAEWASFRAQTLAGRGPVELAVEDLLLLADPEEPGLYLSRFRERVDDGAATGRPATVRRLYWRRSSSGDFRIVAEDNG